MATDESKIIVKLEAEINKLTSDLDRASKKIGNFEKDAARRAKAFDTVFSKTFGNLKAGFAGIAATFSLGSIGKGIIDTAKRFELLNAQLKTVEGSQKAADLAFSKIQEFAATTPYQLDEVVDAYVKLKNRGIEPTVEALQGFGNISAGMGRSLEQISEAVADAASGEFERLKEFGIKANKQGDYIRFTFRGVTTQISNSATEIQRYLENLGNLQFAGAMSGQMNTLQGVSSNLEDSFSRLALKIDSGIGLTGALKNASAQITRFIDELSGTARPIAEIEKQILNIQTQIDGVGGGGSGRRSRARSESKKTILQEQLSALQDELLLAQLASTDAAKVGQGIASLNQQIETLQTDIDRAFSQGDSKTVGTGRNKRLTQLGKDLQKMNLLTSQLESAQARLEEVKLGSGDANQSLESVSPSGLPNELDSKFSEFKSYLEKQVALFGQVGKAAEVRYKIESGALGELTDLQKQQLITKAEELDKLSELAEISVRVGDLKAESLSEEIRAVEDLQAKYTQLAEAVQAGQLSGEEASKIAAGLAQNFDDINSKAETSSNEISEFAAQAARSMQSAFADFLFDPFENGIKGMGEQFALIIQRMIAEAASAQILNSLLGPGFTQTGQLGGVLGSFAGGFADGGTIPAGQFGIVGEDGPEIAFAGNMPVHIIPNELSQRVNGDITVVNNISGLKDSGDLKRTAQQIARQTGRSIREAGG